MNFSASLSDYHSQCLCTPRVYPSCGFNCWSSLIIQRWWPTPTLGIGFVWLRHHDTIPKRPRSTTIDATIAIARWKPHQPQLSPGCFHALMVNQSVYFFQSRVPKHVFFCICMTSATNVLLLNHACSVWLTLLTQSCNSHCAHWNGKTADAFTCLRVQLSSCHGTWLARSFGFLRLSGHPFRVGSLYGNEHLIWLHVIYNDIYDHVVSQVNPREWGGRWQFRIISHGCWIWSDHFRVLVIVHFVLYVWFRWP